MKYQLIIFDWDGTLMDSIDKIVLCMQQAAKQQKQTIPDGLAVKNIIGLSLCNSCFLHCYWKIKKHSLRLIAISIIGCMISRRLFMMVLQSY
ncbi:HAD hydrolase-like protein [Psychromonas sp. L1A2]|uniref:HAD hydrolase-like protein n=1 Tax=Psychromonas sp. L1A2 TaxID=2686356 RepID=UPI002E25EB7F